MPNHLCKLFRATPCTGVLLAMSLAACEPASSPADVPSRAGMDGGAARAIDQTEQGSLLTPAAESGSAGQLSVAGTGALVSAAGAASGHPSSPTTVVVVVNTPGGPATAGSGMIAATMMSVSAGAPAAPSAATMSSAGRGAAGMMAMAGNMARPTGGSMAPPSKPTGGTGGGPSKPSGGTGGTGGGPSKPSGGTGGTGGGPSKPAGGMGGAGGGPATQTRGAGGSGDAPGCTSTSGSDCDDACGNGAIDTGETCDPESTSNQCPSACDDSNPCTLDKLEGSATECTASCRHTPITTAAAGDGCCPPNATAGTDSDCQQQACGDGVVGAGETCDPMSVTDRCPTSCDDDSDCTTDTLTGSAASCTAVCTNTPITIAASGDGCCPSDASPLNDADCDTFCGDGIVSVGELCDPESDTTCPTTCDDGDDCTRDDLEGSIAQCTAECIYTSLEATLAHFDGCCPPGETDRSDSDCERSCGNGTADPGEECDPSAPGEELDVTCDWYCSRIAQSGCSDDFDCPEGTLCVDAQCTTP